MVPKELRIEDKLGAQGRDCCREQPTDDGASDQGKPCRGRELVRFRINVEGRVDMTVNSDCLMGTTLTQALLSITFCSGPHPPHHNENSCQDFFSENEKKSQQSINSSIQNPANLSITQVPVNNSISRLTRREGRGENEIFIIS